MAFLVIQKPFLHVLVSLYNFLYPRNRTIFVLVSLQFFFTSRNHLICFLVSAITIFSWENPCQKHLGSHTTIFLHGNPCQLFRDLTQQFFYMETRSLKFAQVYFGIFDIYMKYLSISLHTVDTLSGCDSVS